MGYIFILYVFYLGWRICKRFELNSDFYYLRILAAPSVGIIFSTTLLFIISYTVKLISPALDPILFSVLFFFSVTIVCKFILLRDQFNEKEVGLYLNETKTSLTSFGFYKKHFGFFLSIALALVITAPVFFDALYLSEASLTMKGYMWSDMTLHLGLIASFAKGENIPPEFIAYPFVGITYHFLFHFLIAVASRLGTEPVHLLNILNIVSFIQISGVCFLMGRRVFKSDWAGILGFLFFCFGSSLAVWGFLWKHIKVGDLTIALLNFNGWMWQGNYERWGLFNFNVYINQRPFPFGIAAFGIFVYLLTSFTLFDDLKKKGKTPFILTGLLIGLMPYFHMPAAISACVAVFMFFIFSNKMRKEIFITGLIAGTLVIPQALMWKYGVESTLGNYPSVHFGYEIGRLDPIAIFVYYCKIFGIKIFTIAAGFILSSKKGRTLFITLLPLFILPNVLQFQHILYDNSKFFILWLLVINIYAAYPLLLLWSKGLGGKSAAALLFISLVGTGVADYYGIMKFDKTTLPYYNDELRSWIERDTKPRSVFLTDIAIKRNYSSYYSVLLSGRRLYVHSIADFAQDLSLRSSKAANIYSSQNKPEVCKTLKDERIDYIVVDDSVRESEDYKLREDFFMNNFLPVYKDKGVIVYSVKQECG
jgi:hypothetical protein